MTELNWIFDNYELILVGVVSAVAAGTAVYQAPTLKDKLKLIKGYIPVVKKHGPKFVTLFKQVYAWAKNRRTK